MRIAFTIAIDPKGKVELVHGPEIPRETQRKNWKIQVAEGLPKKFAIMAFADSPYVLRHKPDQPSH